MSNRKRNTLFKNKRTGYINILLCITIPVLVLGVKYAVDLTSMHHAKIYDGESKRVYKKCAREASLGVAKKWNHGLSLKQQKESLLRIADCIFNKNPAYLESESTLYQAIPGLDARNVTVSEGGKYDPLKVKVSSTGVEALTSLDPSYRVVEYKTVSSSNYRVIYIYGGNQAFYRIMYGIEKDPRFLLKEKMCEDNTTEFISEDMFWDAFPANRYYRQRSVILTLRSEYDGRGIYTCAEYSARYPGANCSSESTTYTLRETENDDKVKISVKDDKIKVQTDNDIGFAVPAECNVDIVLAIPSNGAACNVDNNDRSSLPAGSPLYYDHEGLGSKINSEQLSADGKMIDARSTPIYQVAQAYKAFLRNNFEFTRGVTVGLIPYSGKISIPPDRKTEWTENVTSFVASSFLENQNTYKAYIRGALLYGTSGRKNHALATTYINEEYASYNPRTQYWPLPTITYSGNTPYWGVCSEQLEVANNGVSPLTSIMCRGMTTIESAYGNNTICAGDLLSTADPAESYKFRRMNNNPCYLGHANFLNMKCEWDCTVSNSGCTGYYQALPYFMIEPQSDIGKVCDLLNVIVPFADDYNVSNFVFLPITWANNFFQSWTADPAYSTVSTAEDSATEGRLSCPSKMTPKRKKVLILVVNKPDWFEPQELTYLGFSNDFSEIPMIESDGIRFDINYSDTTSKFADGTNYDETIQGAKKILKFTGTGVVRNAASGFYECSNSGKGKLTFPQKYLVKITVEQMIKWQEHSITSLTSIDNGNDHWIGMGRICSDGSKLISIGKFGYIASSPDGINWTQCGTRQLFQLTGLSSGWETTAAFGNGIWVAVSTSGYVVTSTDGSNWVSHGQRVQVNGIYTSLAFGNGVFMFSDATSKYSYTSIDGIHWTRQGLCPGFARVLGYGNGRWIAGNKETCLSDDNGATWTLADSTLNNIVNSNVSEEWYGACFVNGRYYAINRNNGNLAASSDGNNWKDLGRTPNFSGYRNINCINNRFICVQEEGQRVLIGNNTGTIKFTNITSTSGENQTTSDEYTISERKEFYIEPSQISSTTDGNGDYSIEFDMANMRLISAEITNRPYIKKTPICSMSGTLNAIGKTNQQLTITTNVNAPITIHAKMEKVISDLRVWKNLGNIGTSSNGLLNINDNYWYGRVYYANGKWLAVSKGGYVASSTDGKTWVNHGNTSLSYIDSGWEGGAAYGNGKWLAVSKGGYVAISADGETWVDYGYKGTNNNGLANIISAMWYGGAAYGNGKWLAVNYSGYAASSTDGKVWVNKGKSLSNIASQWGGGIAYGNGKWLVVSDYGYTAYSTNDGDTWVNQGKNLSNIDYWWGGGAAYGNGKWLAVSKDGYVASSTDDGATWVNHGNTGTGSNGLSNIDTEWYGGVSYDNGKWLVVSKDGYVATCDDVPLMLFGTIKYTTPENRSVALSLSNKDYQKFTISPETHKYVDNGNGLYTITLTLDNVQVNNLQVVSSDTIFEYEKLRIPEMSADVDFSKNYEGKPKYNSGLISVTLNKVGYNANTGYWESSDSASYPGALYSSNEFHNSGTYGDFYFLLENVDKEATELRLFNRSMGPDTFYGLKCVIYNFASLHRGFQGMQSIRNEGYAGFDFVNAPTNNQTRIICGGFTLPINTALYYGASGSTMHSYNWQSNGSGDIITYDPSVACQKVTISAYKKLKQEWGSNLRVYVIKYRQQSKYRKRPTGASTDFDYSYIDALVSDSSCLYSASNESELKSALDAIAIDIKSFANYSAAKNVGLSN